MLATRPKGSIGYKERFPSTLQCTRSLLLLALFALLLLVQGAAASSLKQLYQLARHTRIQHGHDAAQRLYAEILQRNPSDLTTSTRLAASSGEPLRLLREACCVADKDKLAKLRRLLLSADFTTRGVSKSLGVVDGRLATARAPIYVTCASAGSVYRFPFVDDEITACQCLIALFLLGLAVPMAAAQQCISEQDVRLLIDLGMVCQCKHDNSLLISVVSVMPVDLSQNDCDEKKNTDMLFIVTDWHPRVLNAIRISESEEAVMYIGPDSLALVQHWILHPNLPVADDSFRVSLLDLCTGSGIQALAALRAGKCHHAVCVDTNLRALRFTAFSACLNGLSDAVTLVTGDIIRDVGHLFYSNDGANITGAVQAMALTDLLRNLAREVSLQPFSAGYNMVTANPPFLPVPDATEAAAKGGLKISANKKSNTLDANKETATMVAARHGLFSAGGSSGEAVLAACLSLSRDLLKPKGYAAIVSEFFFREITKKVDQPVRVDDLLTRLQSYWDGNSQMGEAYRDTMPAESSKGLLLTNQFPISAALYAERRADSVEEAVIWIDHLDREKIAACSPGLLYIQKTEEAPISRESFDERHCWKHVLVPKTKQGSIWTPSNRAAVAFTQSVSREFFNSGSG